MYVRFTERSPTFYGLLVVVQRGFLRAHESKRTLRDNKDGFFLKKEDINN